MEIANDAERMRLWRATRDANHAAWTRQRDLAVEPRATPIYEVTGCGGARLYECHTRRHTYCTPVEAATSAVSNLVCNNGGTIHVTRDAAITCAPRESRIDWYGCANACPASSDCDRRCSNDRACEVSCAADEARCQLGCATVAREQCDANGLAIFGLCASIARDEQSMRDAANRLGGAEATVDHMLVRRQRIEAATASQQSCTPSCRNAGSPRAVVSCLLDCATAARARCEGDEPQTSPCDGFRTTEQALRQQLGPLASARTTALRSRP